jgi:hydroxymethylglutaryl-CoA lyase
MTTGSAHVQLVEVSARDGLQSEAVIVSTADKAELIRRAAAAGLRRIEAVSFVNPKRVPQMADGDELMAMLDAPGFIPQRSDCSFSGLVLNRRGLDNALAARVDEINVVVVVSDTFAVKNQGVDTAGLVAMWHDVGTAARTAGLRTTVTLAASFGCPYEGEVSDERFAQVVRAVMEVPPDELSLADSIGVAAPKQVRERVAVARAAAPATALRCHFHNTRNTGIANAIAAVEAGVSAIDASIGGIGGCPFAPNATGNVATEDVAYALQRMGFATGLHHEALHGIVPWLETVVGHQAAGLLSRAGHFPPSR